MHPTTVRLISFAASLGLALILTPIVIKVAQRLGRVAKPRQDRWHLHSTPALFGGVAIFLSFILPALVLIPDRKQFIGFAVGTFLVFALGFVDDLFNLRHYTKLFGQILTACVVTAFGLTFNQSTLGPMAIPLTIFWLVAITNSFNLLDNMDGLCSGVACVVSLIMFLHACLSGDQLVEIPCLLLAGASLGFLCFNFKPARVFMGDCGSMFLGLSLAILAVMSSSLLAPNMVFSLLVPTLMLAIPLFDTSFVSIVRTLNGRSIAQGGTDHTSHRLVSLGFSERRAVVLLYLISAFFGFIALIGLTGYNTVLLVLTAFAVIGLVIFGRFLAEVQVYKEPSALQSAWLNKISQDKTVLGGIVMYKRRMLEILIDFGLICACYIAAFLLRFDGQLDPEHLSFISQSLPFIVICQLGMFFLFGLYRGQWRYTGTADILSIFKAVSVGCLLSLVVIIAVLRLDGFSRAVYVIDWLLLLVVISGARISIKVFQHYLPPSNESAKRVVIVGAGDAGELVLRDIRNNRSAQYLPVGFLDDAPTKQKSTIHGLAVIGTTQVLRDVIQQQQIEEVIIAMPSVKNGVIDRVKTTCAELAVPCREAKGMIA
jgi:UDP-GlcNAc:undecaprenyl-phosphate GlcNAc-1-phosphate transferase